MTFAKCTMTSQELYQLLELPAEIVSVFAEYEKTNPYRASEEIKKLYLCRETSNDGLEQLQKILGDDPLGHKLLWTLLEIARESWEEYVSIGIDVEIFKETMKFITRFLCTQHKQHGNYHFAWGWWFWRQLSLEEFRVGCLEYELMVENGEKVISLHIPSDADMSPASVDASFDEFNSFLAKYYPDWTDARWLCDSWLLSPALKHLLSSDSNIILFQNRFDIVFVNDDYMGVLDWVFPTHREINESMPENTSLQKNMKAWLLAGNKVGWTKGFIRK